MANSPSANLKKTSETVNSIGRAFAKDIEWRAFEARTKTYLEVIRGLQSLEGHYLARLKGHPKQALEIRRRVAENALEQALLHGCALPICRAKLRAASQLGFENVERKAHFYLLYARGALARGHRRVARRTALAIEAELESSLKRRKSLLGNQCLQLTREILSFVNTPIDSPVAPTRT